MRIPTIPVLLVGSLFIAASVNGCGSDESGSTWSGNGNDGGTLDGSAGGGGSKSDASAAGNAGSAGQIVTDGGSTGCTGDCKTEETGAGTSDPFDPATNDSSGVNLDPNGALVLDRSASQSPRIIWIANSTQSTVSKVDTTTYQELGRYRTGKGDPSRTSVDAVGDVYVGNRTGHSLTKISALGAKCPDTNQDGAITTSTGAADILAYGQDDCVLWETPLNGTIRGVAAQDVYKEVVTDPDLPPDIQEEHYVWVSSLPEGNLWKLDGVTGKVLLTTKVPCPAGGYGLALAGGGQLWAATNQGCLSRIDTTKCVDDASCAAEPVCTTSCQASGECSDSCDSAMMQAITMPEGPYGITVDYKQRIWLGGGTGLKRYIPTAPAASRYTHSGANGFSHGVAADANGWVWGANNNGKVIRMNGDTLENTYVDVGGSTKGMAVDKDGKIWSISYSQTYASVIKPGPGLSDNAATPHAVEGLVGPYTYSDMTGLQAILAKNDPGHYRERFTGCNTGKTSWYQLDWDVETPAGTSVMFRVRTAATEAALDAAKWVTVAVIPTAVPPVDLDAKLKGAGINPEKFLDVEVWLSVSQSTQSLVTPKVTSFGVTHSCPPAIQ